MSCYIKGCLVQLARYIFEESLFSIQRQRWLRLQGLTRGNSMDFHEVGSVGL